MGSHYNPGRQGFRVEADSPQSELSVDITEFNLDWEVSSFIHLKGKAYFKLLNC